MHGVDQAAGFTIINWTVHTQFVSHWLTDHGEMVIVERLEKESMYEVDNLVLANGLIMWIDVSSISPSS